jgi:hypothetical protein
VEKIAEVRFNVVYARQPAAFAADFFAYPLTSVNGAPDSAGEAPGCLE